MARLPSIKRIVKEDIPNAPEWIDQILNPINTFMEEMVSAVDADLTIGDNVRGAIKTITFKTRSTYSNPTVLTRPDGTLRILTIDNSNNLSTVAYSNPVDGWEVQQVAEPIAVKPEYVAIGKITNLDTYKPVTTPTSLSWDYINGVVNINYIAGLTKNTKYEVKLLIF